jgi:hypothetical protein
MSYPAPNQGLIRDYELPTPEPDSPFRPRKPYRFGTLCATVDNPDQKDQYGSSSVPIYQTSTFKGVDGQYDYSRSGNPTRSHLGDYLILFCPSRHPIALQNITSPRYPQQVMHSPSHPGWPRSMSFSVFSSQVMR